MGIFKDIKEDIKLSGESVGTNEIISDVGELNESEEYQKLLDSLDLSKITENSDFVGDNQLNVTNNQDDVTTDKYQITERAEIVDDQLEKNSYEESYNENDLNEDSESGVVANEKDHLVGDKLIDDIECEENTDTECLDEESVIAQSVRIKGDIFSKGSVEVDGILDGNINCNGKLIVTGKITGRCIVGELFSSNGRIEGDIIAKESIKIGRGSVIVGDLFATSAVIAGAVKGNIDIRGPVIVDSDAIISGDIKSKSIQINNGATIDGRFEQCYAEVSVSKVFDDTFSK